MSLLFLNLFLIFKLELCKEPDSTVSIATSYRLGVRGTGVRVPVRQEFSLHVVQTPGAHPLSYPKGNGGSFSGSKAAGA
jgi:hypothetical protein